MTPHSFARTGSSYPYRHFGLVLAVVTLVFVSSAFGQGNPARDAFQRGVAALDAGQFDVAADAFEQSYQLRAVPSVLINLAIARRGQGRYRDAIAAFERFLAEPGPRATPATIAQANSDMQALRAALPTLVIHVEPATSAIALDGQAQTPDGNGIITMDPGRHVVEVTSEGYQIDRRTLDVHASAHETLTVRLVAIGGVARLQVTANVVRANISVDGASRGTGHLDVPLAPGDHTVDVSAAGYLPVHRQIRAGITGVTRLDLTMPSAGAPGWVIPVVAAAAGALLVAGGIILGAYELRGTRPPTPGSWGTVQAQ